MPDLVETLRGGDISPNVARDAADTIERLRETVAELERRRDISVARVAELEAMVAQASQRVTELEERLSLATEFTAGQLDRCPVLIVPRGTKWTVWCGGDVLEADIRWTREQMAGYRTPGFIASTCVTLGEAFRRAAAVCDSGEGA